MRSWHSPRGIFLVAALLAALSASAQQAASPAAKVVGTIKTISGSSIVVAPDAGSSDTAVQLDSTTRVVRVEPGQKDLKGATPLQASQLQIGDRILVRGKPAGENTVLASGIIVMKQSDLAAKQQHDREEWQRHGTGGLVTAVDPSAGTVSLSTTSFAGKKTSVVRVSRNTIIRRYAPDSIRFDDARPAALDQIKVGDQLRARGTRSADGSELTADEIVAGSFRNIAGTVMSVDASSSTINVMDAITKKPVAVRILRDSELRKLPPAMAQHIAMRFKGDATPNGEKPTQPASGSSPEPGQFSHSGGSAGGPSPRNGNGSPDFQQVLSRVPQLSIADLQKGDAVMIVSTEATGSGPVTAFTLLSGVEPILAASPKGGEGMVLSPWSLSGGGGEDSN
jgi:hypothetical protein